MENSRQKLVNIDRRFALSLVPVAITLTLSFVMLMLDDTADAKGLNGGSSRVLMFAATNSLGLLLTLTIEVFRRWSSEEKMMHLTEHIRTDSPLFPDLLEFITHVDSAAGSIASAKRLDVFVDKNPLRLHTQKILLETRQRLLEIQSKEIYREYGDNLLSIELLDKVDRLWAISLDDTDGKFWQSPPGKSYWAAHKRLLTRAHADLDPNALPDVGVVRIFVVREVNARHTLDEIVRQFREGVHVGLYFPTQSIPRPTESAIFGDLAVRHTAVEGSPVIEDNQHQNLRNLYIFEESVIEDKINDFKKLWNASQKVEDERASFTAQQLEVLINKLVSQS